MLLRCSPMPLRCSPMPLRCSPMPLRCSPRCSPMPLRTLKAARIRFGFQPSRPDLICCFATMISVFPFETCLARLRYSYRSHQNDHHGDHARGHARPCCAPFRVRPLRHPLGSGSPTGETGSRRHGTMPSPAFGATSSFASPAESSPESCDVAVARQTDPRLSEGNTPGSEGLLPNCVMRPIFMHVLQAVLDTSRIPARL